MATNIFANLPQEMVEKIFSYLDINDLEVAENVHTSWKIPARSNLVFQSPQG